MNQVTHWSIVILALIATLFVRALVPAVVLGGITWWFQPIAMPYVVSSVLAWEFFRLVQLVQISEEDGPDEPGSAA